MKKYFSFDEVEMAEFIDPQIFKEQPALLADAIECVKRRLAVAEHSYQLAAKAFPGSPMNVHGTKLAMASIKQCEDWLATHM